MTRIGFLYTRLRLEEKYLLEELEKQEEVEVVRINDGDLYFDIAHFRSQWMFCSSVRSLIRVDCTSRKSTKPTV